MIRGTDEHPAAVRVRAELEAEIASLRARVAELEGEKPTLSPWEGGLRRDATNYPRSKVWQVTGGYAWFVLPPSDRGFIEDGPLPTREEAEAAADACARKYWRLL